MDRLTFYLLGAGLTATIFLSPPWLTVVCVGPLYLFGVVVAAYRDLVRAGR